MRHLSLEEKQRKAETEIARLDAQPRKPVDSEWLKKQYLRGNKTAAYVEGSQSVLRALGLAKTAVSLPWIRQHAGSGALKRIKHFDDPGAVLHSHQSALEAKWPLPYGSPARAKRQALADGIEDAEHEYRRQLHNWNYPKVPSATTRSPSLDLPPRIV